MERRKTLLEVPDFPIQALIPGNVSSEAGSKSLLVLIPGLTGG